LKVRSTLPSLPDTKGSTLLNVSRQANISYVTHPNAQVTTPSSPCDECESSVKDLCSPLTFLLVDQGQATMSAARLPSRCNKGRSGEGRNASSRLFRSRHSTFISTPSIPANCVIGHCLRPLAVTSIGQCSHGSKPRPLRSFWRALHAKATAAVANAACWRGGADCLKLPSYIAIVGHGVQPA